jgi:hypothetical protein
MNGRNRPASPPAQRAADPPSLKGPKREFSFGFSAWNIPLENIGNNMSHKCFLLTYDVEQINCWWGIREGACSFLVIDETMGQFNADTSFELRDADGGQIGILTRSDKEQILNDTDAVVHITATGTVMEIIPMTEAQVNDFLMEDDFPLTLAGAREFAQADESS